MNEIKYKELLSKLDSVLGIIKVSPMGGLGDTNGETHALHLSTELDIDSLVSSDLYLCHTLLHNFYATKSKALGVEEIKFLHNKIKEKINHKDYDSLDF